jgi:hypothetical protein
MDTSGLTGSDLEDKLLQDVLLYSCMTDTVYSSGYEDWVAYSDPIPAEPVTVESTPAPAFNRTGTYAFNRTGASPYS